MKTFSLIFLCIFSCCIANAQLYKTLLPSQAFNDSINIIIKDYPNNFHHIQAAPVSTETDVDIFKSSAGLPHAVDCMVYRFHSLEDTTASWQAVFYKGENYQDALKAYKNCYRQIKKSNIAVNNERITFTGKMEEPTASIRFTVSNLKLNTKDPLFKNFYAEIELLQVYYDWEVRLNLLSRKEDTERYNY